MRLDLPSPPIEFEFFGKKTTPTDRVMIGAETTLLGRDLRLFNTHLLAFFMLGSGSTAHPFQRNLVAEQLTASAGPGPTILTGDFNVSRHQTLVSQFAERGYTTVQQTEVTWRRRPFVLDHIFYNSGAALSSRVRVRAHARLRPSRNRGGLRLYGVARPSWAENDPSPVPFFELGGARTLMGTDSGGLFSLSSAACPGTQASRRTRSLASSRSSSIRARSAASCCWTFSASSAFCAA